MDTLKSTQIRYGSLQSPFGEMFVASTDKGLCFLSFHAEKEGLLELKKQFQKAVLTKDPEACRSYSDFFEAKKNAKNLKLDLKGTPFQLKVWEELLKIPAGEVTSYGKIAKSIGRPKAFRAVGTAVGKNPVCVLIPCHRVLPANGKIGNYHWGPERKRMLLEQEGIQVKASETTSK